ncbi:MAG TPA: ACP S-malonyltransferase [Iamia sp.]|nr:ACP S-malonyltransferase [Iamia sp.]
MREALAFPGQGVDPVATVAVLEREPDHPLVALARELAAPHVDGAALTPRLLADTRVAQPCVVAAGLVAAEGHDLGPVVVGHSLGEITACAAAGVLAGGDAVRLVALRAEIGIRATAGRPGMMVAVMRLDHDAIEWIRRLAVGRTGGLLDVAVVNSERQVVLTGDEEAARAAIDLAFEAGGKARRLGIGGAFHSPLLAPAIEEFEAAVVAAAPQRPAVPVVCSTGPVLTEAAEVAPALAASLVRPVDWPRAVARAVALGAEGVVDAGPGETLRNLSEHFVSPPTRALVPAGGDG